MVTVLEIDTRHNEGGGVCRRVWERRDQRQRGKGGWLREERELGIQRDFQLRVQTKLIRFG